MLKRNSDFIALLIVVAGLMAIRDAPLGGVRMLSTRYSQGTVAKRCVWGQAVAHLAGFRSE